MLFNCGPGFKSDEARLMERDGRDCWHKRFKDEGLAIMGDRMEYLRAEHRDAQGLAHAARGMLQRQFEVIFSLPDIETDACTGGWRTHPLSRRRTICR